MKFKYITIKILADKHRILKSYAFFNDKHLYEYILEILVDKSDELIFQHKFVRK